MYKKYLNNAVTLHCNDALSVLHQLPDNSIDLIATDPPYYRVKKDAWDNQWQTVEEYLAWLDEILLECWRVLKPSGSFYLFCGSKLASDTELLVRQRFSVLSHIIWAKPNGPWLRQKKSQLRTFFPATERIIFAEHYGSEGFAKGCAGYATKCSELKQQVFQPLIDYFKTAKEALKISSAEINKATKTQMCSHWFSSSQWQLPSEQQYKQLQQLFNQKAEQLNKSYSTLTDEYQSLDKKYQLLVSEYDDLKVEYETLRRPFSVSAEVPYTDVWTFKPVAHYPGKHPCEKPAEMMEHIIKSSSRSEQIVLDLFMGSGSTGKACIKLGRSFIGVELDQYRYDQTCREIDDQIDQK